MPFRNYKKSPFSTVNSITQKISGFETPTIWYKFTRLAINTNSVNLGQGFPDWAPPEFVLENIKKHVNSPTANHQYTRSFGNLNLCQAIASKYSDIFKRKIDPVNEVLVSNGGVSILYSAITSFVENGDEVIGIEPFYDCYLPQVKFCGGKFVGIPMIAPKFRNKSEFSNLNNKIIKDEWKIDFENIKSSINDKTKMIILNTPNNPTGKILSFDELQELANILEKYPKVIILLDEVYEHMIYDEYTKLPRMASMEKMWNRTITVMSAGKFFSTTGIRIGWCLGPQMLIRNIHAVHQFNSFCLYDPIQLAVADSLIDANKPYLGFSNYYDWLRSHYMSSRNYFVENLAKLQNFDLNFYMPEGGYFVIADISNKKIEQKYFFEGEENLNEKYSRDFNYLLNLAHEKKVVGIPCSAFYTDKNKSFGENYIRLAFCKQQKTMDAAFEKLNKI